MLFTIDNHNNFLKEIPTVPGCYIYKNSTGKILYIGKAVNLKSRVTSYFSSSRKLEPKIISMLEQAKTIECIEVDSEIEALILETSLIKKYKPKYNRMMKDDKSHIWVMFDNTVDFPRPQIVREKTKKSAEYFGPYPKVFPARKVLRRLRKLFPYCNLNFKTQKITKNGNEYVIGNEKRPCLDYHIGLCSGVCAGKISKLEHRRNISNIKRFFKGRKKEIYDSLLKDMKAASKIKNFEKAAKLRDMLNDLNYVTQRISVDYKTDESILKEAKESLNIRSVQELKNKLDIVSRKTRNFKIECYDISNIQGTNATGSMVVFIGGRAAKDYYRKFKIHSKSTPDDFGMMQEVLKRRLKHKNKGKDRSFNTFPDLIIIDGGKGQLSSSYEILKDMKLENEIALAGLAKREEELFQICDGGQSFSRTLLPRRSDGLYLVQRIRDEAHRFAIGYHRVLRSKAGIHSVLDDIPGVGELTKRKLISAFGSLEGISKAKRDDLQTVVRNKRTVEAILKVLQNK